LPALDAELCPDVPQAAHQPAQASLDGLKKVTSFNCIAAFGSTFTTKLNTNLAWLRQWQLHQTYTY
jgi:hypothetical protein